MKALFLVALLTFSAITFASETIEAQKNSSELSILDLVVGINRTYSETSGLEAKVVELLAGDGMNASRMVLILNTGYQDTKIFELDEMMVAVRRITFLAKDVVVINYSQDSFDENDNQIIINKSMTIEVKRNTDNNLADTVEVSN